jgi:acetyltransferase
MAAYQYRNLDSLFRPKSIAIVGASDDVTKIPGQPLNYLLMHKYQGKMYPVNPTKDNILGIKAYPSISAIPDPVEAVVVVIGAKNVPGVMRECAQKGVKAVFIGVSGFGEQSAEGQKLQDEIEAIANQAGMLICGPNTNGLFNVIDKVGLGYSYAQEVVKLGKVAYVSQSGALISATVPRFAKRNVGLAYYVGVGNQLNLELLDYTGYFLKDDRVNAITMYVEGWKTPAKLAEVADMALDMQKPIAVLKVGRSELAGKAAKGHTGALVGSDAAFDSICKQKGIARANDFDELIAITSVFGKYKSCRGNRIGVISSSGGAISIIADQAMKYDLQFPDLTQKTKDEAIKILPTYGEMKNPFDIAAGGAAAPAKAELSQAAVNFVINDDNIDLVIATIHPMDPRGTMNYLMALVEASKLSPKPIIVFTPMGGLRENEEKILAEAGLPTVWDGAEAVIAAHSLISYSQVLERRKSQKASPSAVPQINVEALKQSLKSGRKTLTEAEGKKLLAAYGIPVTREQVAKSADEAAKMASAIGYPVALKIDSPDILHATEAGALKLNIKTEAETRAAYNEIMTNSLRYNPKAEITGVIVQEMVANGREVIVGMSQDPQFGPTVIFGLGGVFVEVLKDISMRVAPISRFDAEDMVKEIKGRKILDAFRGQKEADVDAIVDVILKLARLATDLKDVVAEIDINPLVVLEKGKGARAVDALVVLK